MVARGVAAIGRRWTTRGVIPRRQAAIAQFVVAAVPTPEFQFGQPMVACADLAAYFDSRFGRRLAHFVNEQDIVPRVPPSYTHAGSLVWFTQGTVGRSSPQHVLRAAPAGTGKATRVPDDGLPPLSEDDFEQIKAQYRALNTDSNQPAKNLKTHAVAPPFIVDHNMTFYLDKVRGLFKTVIAE